MYAVNKLASWHLKDNGKDNGKDNDTILHPQGALMIITFLVYTPGYRNFSNVDVLMKQLGVRDVHGKSGAGFIPRFIALELVP